MLPCECSVFQPLDKQGPQILCCSPPSVHLTLSSRPSPLHKVIHYWRQQRAVIVQFFDRIRTDSLFWKQGQDIRVGKGTVSENIFKTVQGSLFIVQATLPLVARMKLLNYLLPPTAYPAMRPRVVIVVKPPHQYNPSLTMESWVATILCRIWSCIWIWRSSCREWGTTLVLITQYHVIIPKS